MDLILDGAKRDRATFTGDLSVAAQTLYDTNDATSYVRGSLDLLGSTQLTSGYVSPFAEPGAPSTGGLIPGQVSVPLGIYSLYFVSDVGDYYTYTGDRSFCRAGVARGPARDGLGAGPGQLRTACS